MHEKRPLEGSSCLLFKERRLSRMLLFIMSASCYRSAGYGGDSFINTELPPQPRPAAEVCLAGTVPASHSALSFRDWISKPTWSGW